MKNIKKLLENKGFSVTNEGNEFFINQYTPAGEDWGFYLDKLEDFKKYAEKFNPESEFEILAEAKTSGFGGVPSYPDLWEDQQWKKNLFNEILTELYRGLKTMNKYYQNKQGL